MSETSLLTKTRRASRQVYHIKGIFKEEVVWISVFEHIDLKLP